MQVKQDIKRIFSMPSIDESFVHQIGHPLVLTSKNISATYNFAYDKLKSKLNAYKANKLPYAARLTIINLISNPIDGLKNGKRAVKSGCSDT